ncbi:MAG: hypothetical protein MSJ26_11390 [Oscillospiraceae bacterium]|nr:hypothetical protein [Oscillospiraceae bacterium]
MDKSEIALQLTLKAMDSNVIQTYGRNDGAKEEVNAFNAKQISDFYNSIYAAIKTEEEFVAQAL